MVRPAWHAMEKVNRNGDGMILERIKQACDLILEILGGLIAYLVEGTYDFT
jgi:hypothetical protein